MLRASYSLPMAVRTWDLMFNNYGKNKNQKPAASHLHRF